MDLSLLDCGQDYTLDKHYTHTQREKSTEWIVKHNLEKLPSVSIVDEENKMIAGDVRYGGENELIIYFEEPVAGKAFMN